MGSSTPIILSVTAPRYKTVIVDTSDGRRYHADLQSFAKVHCFPKNKKGWSDVFIDDYGLALVWRSRFEVHVDQVIALARRVEHREQTRAA